MKEWTRLGEISATKRAGTGNYLFKLDGDIKLHIKKKKIYVFDIKNMIKISN